MTTERLDVVVSERGSRRAAREIDGIGRAARRTSNSLEGTARTFRLLQNALFVVGGAGALRELGRLSDVTGDLQNRLKLVTDSQAEATRVQNELFEITKRTRGEFESTGQVYTRTALAAQELGVSQRELLNFTESLNQSIILSGASNREANAALIQLSQGIASATLRGEELRSVMEQLPFVADVIAKELGVTRGELRALGEDGQISAESVLRAFRNARQEIDEKFSETTSTIAQAFNVFQTSLVEIVAVFNDSTNASTAFAQAIVLISENLGTLAAGIGTVGAVLAARFTQRTLGAVTSAIGKELEFRKAVVSGNAVLLNSVEAERQKAAATQATTAASDRALRAEQARLSANQAQLSQTLQLAQAQRTRAQEQFRASQIQISSSSAATTAQRKLNESTRTVINTQRALRQNQQSLNEVNQQVASSTTVLANANSRLATATAAAQQSRTAMARLGQTVGLVTAGLSRLMALLGGPVGVALIAFGVIMSTTRTRAQQLRDVQSEIVAQADDLKSAYQVAGDSVDEFREKIEGISRTQALVNLQEATRILNDQFSDLERNVTRISAEINAGSFFFASRAESSLTPIFEAFREGAISAAEFKDEIDSLVEANPDLQSLGLTAIDLANSIDETSTSADRAEAIMRVLEGTATDADRALLGFSGSADSASAAANRLSSSAASAASNIRTLIDFIPELRRQEEAQADLAAARSARNLALRDLNERREGGTVSRGEFLEEEARINDLFQRAVNEIDGTAEAAREQSESLDRATSSLREYSQETFVDGLDARQAALEQERQRFEEIRTSLVEAEASQRQLNAARDAYEQRVSNVNQAFDERAAQSAREEARVLENAVGSLESYTNDAFLGSLNARDAALERERQRFESIKEELISAGASQERLNAARQAFEQRTSQINSRFDRKSSGSGSSSEEQVNEALERQTQLLEQIKAPITGYQQNLTDLRALLDQNKISQEEFNRAINQFAIDYLMAQNTIESGAKAGLLTLISETANVAEGTSALMVSVFEGAKSQIADLVVDGQANFSNFINQINKKIVGLVFDQGFQLLAQTVLGGAGVTGGASGSSGGGGGGVLSSLGLPGFATGGSFDVGPGTSVGRISGQDNRLVAFRAQDGERVSVTPRGSEQAAPQVIFNVNTPNAESFRRSESQMAARAQRALANGRRNN